MFNSGVRLGAVPFLAKAVCRVIKMNVEHFREESLCLHQVS